MLFNSEVFFVFLPCVLLGTYALESGGRRRESRLFLAAASFFFYGWWNPAWVPILAASAGFNFVVGQRLTAAGRPAGRAVVVAGVAANLALLGWFKYTNFLLDNLDALTGGSFQIAPIALPIGISFFTFQQIAYLVDAWRGEAEEHHFLDYLVFVTFFPQLIAGPIVHHREMMPQFARAERMRFQLSDATVGLCIFMVGLFKKAVIADGLAQYAGLPFDAARQGYEPTLLSAWTGTLAFTAQIYFDFSGYSDMALGLGRMFGIRLPLNFDSPYKATDINEFWRRWHMTLTRWLRLYLFVPISRGIMRRAGDDRLDALAVATAQLVTMGLCGLWHGAGWTFLLWGALHGVYLVVHEQWRSLRRALGRPAGRPTRWGAALSGALTFGCVAVSHVFFRAESLDDALAVLRGIFGVNGVVLPPERVLHFDAEGLAWTLAALAIAFFTPSTQQWMRAFLDSETYTVRPMSERWRALEWRPSPGWAMAMGLLSVGAVASIWRPSVFLYFQF